MPLQSEQRLRAFLAVQRRHDVDVHVVNAAERPFYHVCERILRHVGRSVNVVRQPTDVRPHMRAMPDAAERE